MERRRSAGIYHERKRDDNRGDTDGIAKHNCNVYADGDVDKYADVNSDEYADANADEYTDEYTDVDIDCDSNSDRDCNGNTGSSISPVQLGDIYRGRIADGVYYDKPHRRSFRDDDGQLCDVEWDSDRRCSLYIRC